MQHTDAVHAVTAPGDADLNSGPRQLRDLRAIDPRFQHQHPVILVRRSSIVARLEKLKAIISPDQVLFFGYDNPSVQHLLPELRSKLANACVTLS